MLRLIYTAVSYNAKTKTITATTHGKILCTCYIKKILKLSFYLTYIQVSRFEIEIVGVFFIACIKFFKSQAFDWWILREKQQRINNIGNFKIPQMYVNLSSSEGGVFHLLSAPRLVL